MEFSFSVSIGMILKLLVFESILVKKPTYWLGCVELLLHVRNEANLILMNFALKTNFVFGLQVFYWGCLCLCSTGGLVYIFLFFAVVFLSSVGIRNIALVPLFAIDLLKLFISSWFNFGRSYASRNLSIPLRFLSFIKICMLKI